jgi:hypothetical protein
LKLDNYLKDLHIIATKSFRSDVRIHEIVNKTSHLLLQIILFDASANHAKSFLHTTQRRKRQSDEKFAVKIEIQTGSIIRDQAKRLNVTIDRLSEMKETALNLRIYKLYNNKLSISKKTLPGRELFSALIIAISKSIETVAGFV